MLNLFGPTLDDYKNTTPVLDMQEFYTGDLKAHGVARNMFGKVMRRFKADVKGAQKDGSLFLSESFTYDDGRTFDRQWELLSQNKEGTEFKGTGADIFGDITAQTSGCSALLKYTLKIPNRKSKGGFKKMKVVHWQYLVSDTKTLHFLQIKKFGITVINSTVIFERV